MYCSRACQRAHWSEHKPVCKQRVAELKIVQDAAPSPSFMKEWAKWGKGSRDLLTALYLTLVNARADVTRATIDKKALEYCLVLKMEYTVGARVPFTVVEYEVQNFEEWMTLNVSPVQRAELRGNRDFADIVNLNACAMIGNTKPVVRTITMPTVRKILTIFEPGNPADIVGCLNAGSTQKLVIR